MMTTELEDKSALGNGGGSDKLGKAFLSLWLGQIISSTGSMLTSFALAVWIFQRSGSIIDFSGTILFATVPALLVTPWAGSLADRGNKRRLMFICTILSALCTTGVGLLVWLDKFQLWHVYSMLVVLSVTTALRGPATQAMVANVVPKAQLGRASGMLAISGAAAQIIAPLLGGVLLGIIGLSGIIVLDVIGYSVALLSLLALPAHTPHKVEEGVAQVEGRQSLGQIIAASLRGVWRDNMAAFAFFRTRPTLMLVFAFMISAVFMSGMVSVLITPLVLSMYDATTLAIITTCGALGALAGGVGMAVWGGPKRFSVWLLGLNVVEGAFVLVAGGVQAVPILCVCAFFAMCASTLLCTNVENLWRRKVPLDQQGSVFALEQFMNMAMIPLAAVIGGVAVEYLFEPALLPGGLLFDNLGQWFGTGKGRGTGLFFVVTGGLVVLWSLLVMSTPRLRHLEEDVKDVV